MGLGLAFLVDAATFLVSAITLWFVEDGSQPAPVATGQESLVAAIGGGLHVV